MAIKGSRSSLNRLANVTLSYQGCIDKESFNVAPLDNWDVILGMPFLSRHKAIINLGRRSVYLPDQKVFMEPWKPRSNVYSLATTISSSHNADFDPIKEFPDVFPNFETMTLTLPPLRPGFDHQIRLKDPTKVINPATFRVPFKYLNQLSEKLQKDLNAGRIYPSSSSQAATLFCVPKPGGKSARFVTDMRAMNDNMVRDVYPIPD